MLIPGWKARAGRAAVDSALADVDIPDFAAALVRRTVSATRLWPGEQADVARELAAHFADGASGGRGEADLISAFGDADRAAGLIRRAKKRGRPPTYRALKRLMQAAVVCILFSAALYAYLAIRYYAVSPTIARNFTKELNAPTLAAPEADRAWPVYIEAVEALGADPEFIRAEGGAWPLEPGASNWDEGRTWIENRQRAITLIREGATRPMTGYIYSNTPDEVYIRLKERIAGAKDWMVPERQENPILMGVLLPHLGELRRLARVIASDLAIAGVESDSERAVADIRALLGIARQTYAEPMLISRLVGVAVATLAADRTLPLLRREGFFSREQLRIIAHEFAGFAGGRVSMYAESERLMWEDVAQRVFSDDGKGNGHVVHAAFPAIAREFGTADPSIKPIVKVVMPAVAVWNGTRSEFMSRVQALDEALARDDALPAWCHSQRTSGEASRALLDRCDALLTVFRSLQGGEEENTARYFWSRDVFEAKRAAVLTASSLEVYRLDRGAFPALLTDLVPEFMSALPTDPFDGRPMRYAVRDGAPLLWSIGTDGKDDGGRPPSDPKRDAWNPPGTKTAADGDWILYPFTPPRRQ